MIHFSILPQGFCKSSGLHTEFPYCSMIWISDLRGKAIEERWQEEGKQLCVTALRYLIGPLILYFSYLNKTTEFYYELKDSDEIRCAQGEESTVFFLITFKINLSSNSSWHIILHFFQEYNIVIRHLYNLWSDHPNTVPLRHQTQLLQFHLLYSQCHSLYPVNAFITDNLYFLIPFTCFTHPPNF